MRSSSASRMMCGSRSWLSPPRSAAPRTRGLEDRADDRRHRHRKRCFVLESGARGVVEQAVRTHHRGRRSLVRARAGHDHRLPRPERRRQDDDAADAARARRADERPRARLRPALRGARAARAAGSGRCSRRPTSTRAAPAATTCACSARQPSCHDSRVEEVLATGRARAALLAVASRATRSACVSGWGWPRRCSATPSC